MGKAKKAMARELKISVIVPVYNVENYLEQCVDSILAQTYPVAEIVLVDDGSTDSSGALCDHFAAMHRQLKVVHKKNAGLGFARNTGLDCVSPDCDYVMFVDSDDWLEPNAVESLVSAMGGKLLDCVIGGHTKKTADGETIFTLMLENCLYEGDSIRQELLPRLCGSMPTSHDSVPMSAYSALYARSMPGFSELRFPSEREMISEDFVYKFNVLRHARTAATCDFTGYCYRTVVGSLTKSYRADRFDACCHFFDESMHMLEEAGFTDAVYGEAALRLRKTFFIYLRMCIKQERPTVSGKGFGDALGRLREILDNEKVRETIADYPVESLAFRQRLFMRMVQMRMAVPLLSLAMAGAL